MSQPGTITDEELKTFFREFLMPIAAAAKARGIEYFPRHLDWNADTYYKERPSGESYIHEIDAEDLAGELRSLWSDDAIEELAALSERIEELASGLREFGSQSDDVSPFVYAMF